MSNRMNMLYRHCAVEEQGTPLTPDAGAPPDPTPPSDGFPIAGYTHYDNPVTYPGYAASYADTYSPDVSLYGSAYTVNSGTWNRDGGREYTLGNGVGQRARVDFANSGKTHYAGRIDSADRAYMNANPNTGWNGYPAMENLMIHGGPVSKPVAADPAVFPEDMGPHLHSFDFAADSYWNATTLRLTDTNSDDLLIPRSDIVKVLGNQTEVRLFAGMSQGYWPTFIDPILASGRSKSWYIGRPRNVAGIRSLPTWEGKVIDMPQGLRMATFRTTYTSVNAKWQFVAAFPTWWNGTDLWLPGAAHLVHGDDPGSGQQGGTTHPWALPLIHLFIGLDRSTSLAKPLQSAQVTNANPAAIMHGQRRDYWNYNNVNVATHAEIHVCWDPIFSNFVTWAINNRFGLGRIGKDF